MMKNSSVEYCTVDDEHAGQRLDNFLITRLKGVPRTHIYRILRKGEVRVNKKRAQPSYRLQTDDQIRIPPLKLEPVSKPSQPSQSLTKLLADRILYENDLLIVLNKPSGIAVHGGSGVTLGVVEALRTMYPKSPNLELAHRLDSHTSGCLILAKKRSVLRELHELLRNGQVKKVYSALTKGHWQSKDLRVEAALLKNQLSSGERIVKVNEGGKSSLTVFSIQKEFEGATLVEAELHTGRTHQIRVHAQYKKHPIAGDEKYGDKEFNKKMRQLGLKRLFLHAQFVEFTLPMTGKLISVTAPLDKELKQFLLIMAEQ